MKEKGFTVLDGEPVTVDGIRFLGSSDPRSSGLTAGYNGDESDNIAAIGDAGRSADDRGVRRRRCQRHRGPQSRRRPRQAAQSGCVDLVLSGHLHRQVGPTVVDGLNGRSTMTLTTGTTGGAVYAFALGSKLRRTAQVTIVTFADGVPVGLQP